MVAFGLLLLASPPAQATASRGGLPTTTTSTTSTTSLPAGARRFSCKGRAGRDGKYVEGTLSSSGVLTDVIVKDWTGQIIEADIANPQAVSNPTPYPAYDFPGYTYWSTSTKPYPTTGHALWAVLLPSAQPAGPTFTAIYQIRTIWFAGTACSYLS